MNVYPNHNPNRSRGEFSSGQLSSYPNPKTNPNLDPNPNFNRGAIFLRGGNWPDNIKNV